MPESQGKIKEFFEQEAEKVAEKIKRTPTEKFFIIFLIIMTFSALVLGYLQFKKNIESPYFSSYLSQKRALEREKYLNANSATGQDLTKLQNQDSDLDGLSDYQELYIYNTNPYLEDTDGDSIWDKQEIDAGTDPNCAQGQVCESQASTTQNTNTNTNASSGLSDMNSLLDLEQRLLSGEVTLKDLGIDNAEMQTQIDAIKGSNVNISEELTPEEQQALNNLKDITPAELRTELESQGVDKTMLDNISDENLQKIFLQILSQYQ